MAAEDWTEQKIETLTKMWNNGASCSQIGERIGMTRNAVIGKRKRLGLVPRGKGGRDKATKIPKRPPMTPEGKGILMPQCNVSPVRTTDNAPVPMMIPLLDLEDNMCHWVSTDDSPYLYCGHACKIGSAYCQHHNSRMRVKAKAPKDSEPLRRAA